MASACQQVVAPLRDMGLLAPRAWAQSDTCMIINSIVAKLVPRSPACKQSFWQAEKL